MTVPTDDAEATQVILTQGFIVMGGVLESAHVVEMREVCEKVLARRNALRTRVPLELHRRPPLGVPSVYAHPALVPIVRELIGEASVTEFWIRSTAPGSRPDKIHRDRRGLPPPGSKPVNLGVDFMLTDCTPENGATEIWPGSQLLVDRDEEDLRNTRHRAGLEPSVPITGTAGSAVLRDLRAWHRAGANHDPARRILLSVVYEPR